MISAQISSHSAQEYTCTLTAIQSTEFDDCRRCAHKRICTDKTIRQDFVKGRWHTGAGAKENDAGARMCATIGMGPNLSQTDSGSAHHYAQASSFPRILMARPYLVRRLRPWSVRALPITPSRTGAQRVRMLFSARLRDSGSAPFSILNRFCTSLTPDTEEIRRSSRFNSFSGTDPTSVTRP